MGIINDSIKALFTALLLLLFTSGLQAQTKKFGDISAEDFSDYNAEYDSTESAVVLFNKGEVEFDKYYNCYLDVHQRVKILTDEGLERGDVEIWQWNNREQSVRNIEAATYKLSENGDVERLKLNGDDIYEEKRSEDATIHKFTLPGLSPGDIIEFKYRKKMGRPYMMPDWRFHDYIPVQWSEIKMTIPLVLNYRMILKGADSLYKSENRKIASSNEDYQELYLVKKDLPGVEQLPYLINRDDHVSEVITQLVQSRLPGYMPRDFFKSWDAIAEELNLMDEFGYQRLNSVMEDTKTSLISEDMDDVTKAEVIYNYISSNIEWNGRYAVVSEKGIRDTFEDKKGNTADINLMLVEMLRSAGLKASPALISTRTNGNVILDYPIINQFNMVVAAVEMGESAFIMDASAGKRSFRFPHPKILYRNALVIRDDKSYGWLLTLPIDNSSERVSMSYSLMDSGKIHIQLKGNLKGAYAESLREKARSYSTKEYWEEELTDLPGLEVDSAEFKNLENLSEEISYSSSFSFNSDPSYSTENDVLYLQPFLFLKAEENPFKKSSRKFPVEFSYPFSKQWMVQVQIPEGFEIDEIPENIQTMLPNQGGYYRFLANVQGNTITMVSHTNIAGIYFPPEEYAQVKQFFQDIYDSQNATVVLKRKGS